MPTEDISSLSPLFQPHSIAVIGATDKAGRIGFQLVKNLVNGRFPGKVYPINPHLTELMDQPVYASVEDVPSDVDLGIIVIHKKRVLDAVEACGRKGVRAVIIMSSGFSELGDEKLEAEITRRVRHYNMRMLGPNCAGFVAPWEQVFSSFENRIQKGHLAFISQSGAMCAVVLALARAEQLGFSMFISYGNAADLGPEELLQYLGNHEPTKMIGCYVEGLRNARRFLTVARKIGIKKPILILKPGDTPAAIRAIKSHTGALAGEQAIYSGAFRQSHVLQAHTLEEFIDASKVLMNLPLPSGNRVGIVTNSGGPGVLAVDACSRVQLQVPIFKPSLVKQFKSFLPPVLPLSNPVDVGPEGDARIYQQTIQLLLASRVVDIVLVLCVPTTFADICAISKAVVKVHKEYPETPLATCWLAGDIVSEGLPILAKAGIPNLPTPQRAATALHYLVLRAQWIQHNSP
ncbi:MAG: acetate--CoA ligase family protein [Promethearchaeota archaeon]